MSGAGMVVIGGGPAGLAAASEFCRRGQGGVIFEQDRQVGGLSRTVVHNGFRFDIGGHRFFTKNGEVEALWRETLPNDFLKRPRLSRIYYRGKFFSYPLRIGNALAGLGPLTSARVGASFLAGRLFPKKPETSFEDWVSNRFGKELYSIFFKAYTEKVWGISCTELSADWAAQRIRNLDLGKAVLNALRLGGGKVASLIEEFDYPRHGPGQMYEAMAERVKSRGFQVQMGRRVMSVRHDGSRVGAICVEGPGGVETVELRALVSSMPITELVARMDPPPPPEVLEAARALRYRSIVTANLILDGAESLPDTWIYLHDPEVQACRLQVMANWSPELLADRGASALSLEYFAFEDEGFWAMSDGDLLDQARRDLSRIAGERAGRVRDGFVFRYAKAYPMYDGEYGGRLKILRAYLERFSNLVCVGRYGQFRYNNMDHAMLTGMLGARRLLGDNVDPWSVNADAEYHEERKG